MTKEFEVALDSYGTMIALGVAAVALVTGASELSVSMTEGTNQICYTENVGCVPPNALCSTDVVCGF